ncbi:MAG: hypothetical protein V8Q93_04285 [Blautia faecis]
MKKIAVIQDLSGLGKCSLTAAIPVISVMGVQAVPLPTAVLSNQTGYPSYYCDDYTEHMEQIMDEWEKRGFSPDGIYTGFLADEEQADKILDFFQKIPEREDHGAGGSGYGRQWQCLWNLYRRSAGKDASAGGKRPCDYAQSYGSSASFIWERRDGKKICQPFGTGWKEKAGTDRKDWGAAEKRIWLTGSCDYRRGVYRQNCVYIRWEIW